MLTIEIRGLDHVLKRIHGLERTELRRKAIRVMGQVARDTVLPAIVDEEHFKGHGKTPGAMRKKTTVRKLRTRPGEVVAYSVRPRTFYTPMVIGGTKPHTIRPKRAKALSFYIGNRRIVTGFVQHPGAKPNPIISRAARRIDATKIASRLGKELMK